MILIMKVFIFMFLLGLSSAGISQLARKPFGQRIIGGVDAIKGDFPFIVDLQREGRHYCAGSIITSEWILTAAHCAKYAKESYTIVAGDHNIMIDDGTEQIRRVVQIVKHGEFDEDTLNYDGAMMKVDTPFDLSGQWVKASVLADKREEFIGDSIVAGWGVTHPVGEGSDILQNVTVPLVGVVPCAAAYNPQGYVITPNMICAGTSGRDSCQGDSGGPMLCQRSSGVWVHCGIVSWGIGCARPEYPGVYARTSEFLDFIKETQEGIIPPCDGFECSNGLCIPPHYVCDTYKDCPDNEDELDCHKKINL